MHRNHLWRRVGLSWHQVHTCHRGSLIYKGKPYTHTVGEMRTQASRRGPYPNIHRWRSRVMSHLVYKQRFLTPGHQGWNDLHSLCRIGMEYYLLNNDDNNIIYWIMMIIMIMMMMIIIMIIMMTMMIIGTATIMIMIIIITTTLTMTIMKMIMIKTAQTQCQSLYKDRRI